MKNKKKVGYILWATLLLFQNITQAQFGSIGAKLLKIGATKAASTLGIEKLLKHPQPITTSFEDAKQEGSKMPNFAIKEKAQPLYLLPKAPDGGFVLCEGLYEMTNKSYCLHAGTFAPSKGDGYMFAPTDGSKEDIVIAILKNAEKHPEIEQHDIQILLWAIIAKTKFSDYNDTIKATAIQLLTPKQITLLEGGALAILPLDLMEKAKDQLPNNLKAIFEAENNIRNLVTSGNYDYSDMEQQAIIAGFASPRKDIPSGIWTLHPDGYYIRYFPSSYSITKVQIYVPASAILATNGKKIIYDATNDIACPANTGSQRLAQTNEPLDPDYSIKLNMNIR
jgi:hypothetical protein